MDDFKKYINEHRQQLDVDEPSDHLFGEIEKRLTATKPKVITMVFKWAAAACIILLAGVGVNKIAVTDEKPGSAVAVTGPTVTPDSTEIFNKTNENKTIFSGEETTELIAQTPLKQQSIDTDKSFSRNSPTQKTKTNKQPAPPEDPMYKAFADMDKSYASMVSLQIEKVKGTPIYAEDAGYFHVFKKQFQDLTNDEKVLKEETKKFGINDDIITRMINIYQEKISLLKQLQFEINKMNNKVNNTNADVQQKLKPTYINL